MYNEDPHYSARSNITRKCDPYRTIPVEQPDPTFDKNSILIRLASFITQQHMRNHLEGLQTVIDDLTKNSGSLGIFWHINANNISP